MTETLRQVYVWVCARISRALKISEEIEEGDGLSGLLEGLM